MGLFSGITNFVKPFAGDLLGGLIGAGGQVYSDQQTAKSVAGANEMNRAIAREQMRFQEAMSNSAYQRAVADMRKAGVNPLLAISKGGASTPAGAGFSAQSMKYGNIGASAATSAASMAQADLTSANAAIQERTLEMLSKEKITLPELQYTASNIFRSKMLRAVEAGLRGDTKGLTPEYAAIATKISGLLRDSGIARGGAGARSFRLDQQGLAKLFGIISEATATVGYDGITDFGIKIMELIKND